MARSGWSYVEERPLLSKRTDGFAHSVLRERSMPLPLVLASISVQSTDYAAVSVLRIYGPRKC